MDPEALHSKIGRIRERYPLSRIALLAEDSNRERLSSALEAGANAALLTSMTPDGLVKSLQALMSDELVVVDAKLVTSSVASNGAEGFGLTMVAEHASNLDLSQQPAKGLSIREIEILDRIVQGDSNKLIARRFDIAEATVKAHVKAILRKIGATNRTQAAIWAMNAKPTEAKDASGLLAPSPQSRGNPDPSDRRIIPGLRVAGAVATSGSLAFTTPHCEPAHRRALLKRAVTHAAHSRETAPNMLRRSTPRFWRARSKGRRRQAPASRFSAKSVISRRAVASMRPGRPS